MTSFPRPTTLPMRIEDLERRVARLERGGVRPNVEESPVEPLDPLPIEPAPTDPVPVDPLPTPEEEEGTDG